MLMCCPHVIWLCVSPQAAQKLSAVSGRRCLPLCVDVRQPETIAAAVDATLKEFGRIDILINSMWPCQKCFFLSLWLLSLQRELCSSQSLTLPSDFRQHSFKYILRCLEGEWMQMCFRKGQVREVLVYSSTFLMLHRSLSAIFPPWSLLQTVMSLQNHYRGDQIKHGSFSLNDLYFVHVPHH